MKLQDFLEWAGYKVQSYSGRGMFGKQCLAIVTKDNLAEVLLRCVQFGAPNNIQKIIPSASSDNMGRSTVYYWPNEKYEESIDE